MGVNLITKRGLTHTDLVRFSELLRIANNRQLVLIRDSTIEEICKRKFFEEIVKVGIHNE